MSSHHDATSPSIKSEPDDLDGDAHYHHRKHRHTQEPSLTSPSQQQSNDGHGYNSNHTAGQLSQQWGSTSPIQPIKRLDPLQAEVETLRKQNLQLQAEVAALQEKLKATSIHSSPSTSPLPIQHTAQQQQHAQFSTPPVTFHSHHLHFHLRPRLPRHPLPSSRRRHHRHSRP